jgi:hypothetical protein
MGDFYMTTPVPPFPTAIGAAFNTFTSRLDVSPQPLPVIQGYILRLGAKIKIEAEGEFSTTGTPTLALGFYIGTAAGAITTVIAESGAITTGSGAASWPWRLEYRGIITALGVTGQCVGSGNLELGTSLTALSDFAIPATLALRTIVWDTTIARAIGVCATYSVSSISNAVKTYNHSVLILN